MLTYTWYVGPQQYFFIDYIKIFPHMAAAIQFMHELVSEETLFFRNSTMPPPFAVPAVNRFAFNNLIYILASSTGSRDGAVAIATDYRLEDRGVKGLSPDRARTPLLHVYQTGYGDHPVSYPAVTAGCLPEVERPGRKSDHSPPNTSNVNKTWLVLTLPHMPSSSTA
jgi:hypothetical protein